ncbi:EamA family transporter [Micromonospora sp. KC606]|nr:EamA family transporter [Micromonospora sp. KC606]
MLLAVVGVLVLEGAHPDAPVGLGDLLVFGGLVSAAAYVLVARGIADRVDALTMTAHQSAFGLAVILPFGVAEVVRGGPRLLTGHSAGGWLIALAIGVFGFGASFLLYNFALATVRAGRAGIILRLLPVFGVLSAVAVLGERIGGWQWCGAALIVASIFVFPDGEPED